MLTLSEKRSLHSLAGRVLALEQEALETKKRAQVYDALGSNQFMSMADIFELVLAMLDHFFRAAVQAQIVGGNLDEGLHGLPLRSCSVNDVSYTACLLHSNKKKGSPNTKILCLMDVADNEFFELTKLKESSKNWMRMQLIFYQENIKQLRNKGAHVFSTILVHVKDAKAVRPTTFHYPFSSIPYAKTKINSLALLRLQVLRDISQCIERQQLQPLFSPMAPLLIWVIPWVEKLLRVDIDGEQ